MAVDVVLTFRDVDFAPFLATYKVNHEINYARQVTALDGTEYTTHGTRRPIVSFTLRAMSDTQAGTFYAALSTLTGTATYTDPYLSGETQTARMRLASDLEAVFGLRSVDGNRYYKGGEIQLRGVTPLA